MKIQITKVYDGMIWAALPLMCGLYYWEHTLRLIDSGHKAVQILMMPVVFGWVYYWNRQAENERLRHFLDDKGAETKLRYRLVTTKFFTDEPYHSAPGSIGQNPTISKDQPEMPFPQDGTQYTLDAKYHASNN